MSKSVPAHSGFTLIELLTALAISALLLSALTGVVGQALMVKTEMHAQNEDVQQARFAMERLIQAIRYSPLLLLPSEDDSGTAQDESSRAMLVVALDPSRDLDGDGVADVDNDEDGRIDEDWPADINNDGNDGVSAMDDDGDSSIDEDASFDGTGKADDDEDGIHGEDPVNGLDDDDDGRIDEDPTADMNGDGAPGLLGVDDDGDGTIDEGVAADDDEDGLVDEDWLDTVSFILRGTDLVERFPVPWDEDNSGVIDGADFLEETIAENVSQFTASLVSQSGDRFLLVDLDLELTNPVTGEIVNLTTRVRVGAAL